MKKLLAFPLIALTVAACNIKDPASNDANIRKMEDTLFKSYPTVNGVSIEVKENTEVIITLRDVELYNEGDEKETSGC